MEFSWGEAVADLGTCQNGIGLAPYSGVAPTSPTIRKKPKTGERDLAAPLFGLTMNTVGDT